MKVFKTVQNLREHLAQHRFNSKIGLVPTMGALHQGHISLVKESLKNTDVTVVSIFVNPAQFNKAEDLEKYPRTIEADLEKLENSGCDIVFIPNTKEIYPTQPELKIDLGEITNELEGKFRPGHFNGVGLVVSKLFNIIQPDTAFFGQKDLQQFFAIKKLVDELSFPLKLEMVPTQREKSGLAMSSRNMRLSEADRETASLLYNSLKNAQTKLLNKETVSSVKQHAKELFEQSERLTLEYFEVIDTSNFKALDHIEDTQNKAICIAAEIGGIRLIDNLLLIS